MTRDKDPRIITIKYNTTCAETGKPLNKGDQAVYYPKSKDLFHLESEQATAYRMWKADQDMGHNY